MPLECIAAATYRVRARYPHSPSLLLRTDERDLDRLPAAVRRAGDQIWLGAPESALDAEPAADALPTLIWRKGERLLAGSETEIRSAFHHPGRRFFLPVHYPGPGMVVDDDLDLIGLEPRAFTPTPPSQDQREDGLDPHLRILAARAPAAPDPAAARENEAWRALAACLHLESAQLGAGVAPLAAFAGRPGLHAVLHALALRNLAVILMRQRAWKEAENLLALARQQFPDYRELDYLGARLALAQRDRAAAVTFLKQATRSLPSGGSVFVGSGGESGYRAHCLLATVAESAGGQSSALHHFLTGVRQRPAHAPSVAGVLRQRVPQSLFAAVELELSALGRREPQYQAAIADFFLLHRAFAATERLIATWPLATEDQQRLTARLSALAPLYQPMLRLPWMSAGVMIEGPLLMHTSVAQINRQLAAALQAEKQLEVALDPTLPAEQPEAAFPRPAAWAANLRRLPSRLDLTIRHGWPPNFDPPAAGRLAVILPWEFGAIPKSWIAPMQRVDEIWVPSEFVRHVLLRAGVAAERVVVIPNGVDLELYQPNGDRHRPEGSRATSFLFVGGAIRRKGLDVLLAAWRAAFSASDDVSLTIKSLGGKSFYRHLHLGEEIATVAADPGAAPVIHIEEELSDAVMPELYRGADVVALPYRGEGFGMPLAEALASGIPVITTALGPAPEFCPREASWMISAKEVEVPEALRLPMPLTGAMTWFEPSVADLAAALRAAADPAQRAPKAQAAVAGRDRLGWAAVTARYRERVLRLI